MHAVDALAHHALRSPQRVHSLRSAARASCAAPSSTASSALHEYRPAPGSAAKSSRPAHRTHVRRRLSRNRVAAVAERALRIRSSGPAVAWLRKSADWILSLAHGDRADHLHGVGGSGLAELRSRVGCPDVVSRGVGAILILCVQPDLLKRAAASTLARSAGTATWAIAPSSRSAALRAARATESSALCSRICAWRGAGSFAGCAACRCAFVSRGVRSGI